MLLPTGCEGDDLLRPLPFFWALRCFLAEKRTAKLVRSALLFEKRYLTYNRQPKLLFWNNLKICKTDNNLTNLRWHNQNMHSPKKTFFLQDNIQVRVISWCERNKWSQINNYFLTFTRKDHWVNSYSEFCLASVAASDPNIRRLVFLTAALAWNYFPCHQTT